MARSPTCTADRGFGGMISAAHMFASTVVTRTTATKAPLRWIRNLYPSCTGGLLADPTFSTTMPIPISTAATAAFIGRIC